MLLILQIYATSFGFVAAHPMKAKLDAHLTLDKTFWTVGIPSSMVPDKAILSACACP
jgi:hypothetical protein